MNQHNKVQGRTDGLPGPSIPPDASNPAHGHLLLLLVVVHAERRGQLTLAGGVSGVKQGGQVKVKGHVECT